MSPSQIDNWIGNLAATVAVISLLAIIFVFARYRKKIRQKKWLLVVLASCLVVGILSAGVVMKRMLENLNCDLSGKCRDIRD